MVDEIVFKEKVKEFCELVNTSVKSNSGTGLAIYNRIKQNYVNDDIIRAFDDMVERETKLSFPICRKYFDKFRSIRMDTEAQRRRMTEKTETQPDMLPGEIQELIDMILLKKKPNTYLADYLKANSTIFLKDGRCLSAWIDPEDPNLEYGKALSVTYEQDGEHTARRVSINLKMVNHKILMPQQNRLALVDDDFIPELELPNVNDLQGTLGMDRPTGGDAR